MPDFDYWTLERLGQSLLGLRFVLYLLNCEGRRHLKIQRFKSGTEVRAPMCACDVGSSIPRNLRRLQRKLNVRSDTNVKCATMIERADHFVLVWTCSFQILTRTTWRAMNIYALARLLVQEEIIREESGYKNSRTLAKERCDLHLPSRTHA